MRTAFALALMLACGCASAQTPTPSPTPPGWNHPGFVPAPSRVHGDPAAIAKYRSDMVELHKHSRAYVCLGRLKAAGLAVTPENLATVCPPTRGERAAPPASDLGIEGIRP